MREVRIRLGAPCVLCFSQVVDSPDHLGNCGQKPFPCRSTTVYPCGIRQRSDRWWPLPFSPPGLSASPVDSARVRLASSCSRANQVSTQRWGVLRRRSNTEGRSSAMSLKMSRRRSPLRRWCLAIVAGAVAASGCSAPGQSLEVAPEVVVNKIGATLHSPVWSYSTKALIGLSEDGRLAVITDPLSPEQAMTRLSPPMAAGRNLQISRKNDRQVFVPQPDRGKVAVVDLATLLKSMTSTPDQLPRISQKTPACGCCSRCRRTGCR